MLIQFQHQPLFLPISFFCLPAVQNGEKNRCSLFSFEFVEYIVKAKRQNSADWLDTVSGSVRHCLIIDESTDVSVSKILAI